MCLVASVSELFACLLHQSVCESLAILSPLITSMLPLFLFRPIVPVSSIMHLFLSCAHGVEICRKPLDVSTLQHPKSRLHEIPSLTFQTVECSFLCCVGLDQVWSGAFTWGSPAPFDSLLERLWLTINRIALKRNLVECLQLKRCLSRGSSAEHGGG